MDIIVSFKPTSTLKNHQELREQLMAREDVVNVEYVSDHLTLFRVKHSLDNSNVKTLTTLIRTFDFIDDLSFDPRT